MANTSMWNPELIRPAIGQSFRKLSPAKMIRNPVMFVVEIGSVLTTVAFAVDLTKGDSHEALFSGQISLWLWFTVLFANFAEAMARAEEGAGENLKKARTETQATRRGANGELVNVASSELKKGDVVVVVAGQSIPAGRNGDRGVASVDESAITASPHRSFVKPDGIAAPVPAEHPCSPIASSFRLRRIRESRFSTA